MYSDQIGRMKIASAFNEAVKDGKLKVSKKIVYAEFRLFALLVYHLLQTANKAKTAQSPIYNVNFVII